MYIYKNMVMKKRSHTRSKKRSHNRSKKRSPKRYTNIQSSLKFNLNIPFINYYMEQIVKNDKKHKIEMNKLFDMQQQMNLCPDVLLSNEQLKNEQLIKTYLENNNGENCKNVNCMIHLLLNSIAEKTTNNVEKYGENLCIPSLLNHTIFQNIFKPTFINDGAYGMVFKCWFYNTKDVFIIKVPLKSSIYEQETIHESLICSYLNTLREKTTGFSYSFNGFQCGISKDPKDLCKYKNPRDVSYISIYEYVSNTSLRTVINKNNLSMKYIFNIILIVLNNLRIAQQEFKFVHCDLHSGNILIKKLSKIKTFKINNYEIATEYEPVIIDFGMSTISIKTDDNTEIDLNRGSFVYSKKLYLQTFDIYRLISDVVHVIDRDKKINRFINYETELLSYFWNNAEKLGLKQELKNDKNRRNEYSNFYENYNMMKIFSLGTIDEYIDLFINFIRKIPN